MTHISLNIPLIDIHEWTDDIEDELEPMSYFIVEAFVLYRRRHVKRLFVYFFDGESVQNLKEGGFKTLGEALEFIIRRT